MDGYPIQAPAIRIWPVFYYPAKSGSSRISCNTFDPVVSYSSLLKHMDYSSAGHLITLPFAFEILSLSTVDSNEYSTGSYSV